MNRVQNCLCKTGLGYIKSSHCVTLLQRSNKHHLAYIKLLTAELSFCQVTSHSSIWPLKSKRQSPFVSWPDHYQEFSFSLPISLCVNDFYTEFCFDSCIWYLSLWCIEICPLSLLIVNFEHVFLFRTTGPISTKRGTKLPWINWAMDIRLFKWRAMLLSKAR